MPNYLGIDFGAKRIGLAWADELSIALPVGAIPGVLQQKCWDAISKEISERKINEIVVGYPIHMDGQVGVRAREVDEFVKELKNRYGLPVHRVDERLTSHAARAASEPAPSPSAFRWVVRTAFRDARRAFRT